jgi:RND family efflux transporter MFP subunit
MCRLSRVAARLAALGLLPALAAGCEPAAELKAGTGGPPVARLETVLPERHDVRRTVAVPGQLQAFETTAIHAKVAGYVAAWHVNIGDHVKKGQALAELAVPELVSERDQKRAAVEQAVAKQRQAESAVKVGQANLVGAEARLAEARVGVGRVEADLARWKSESDRVERLFQERAMTGSLRDETLSKLRSAEASRDEVLAQVRSAEARLNEARAVLEQTRSDLAAAASSVEVAREEAHRVEAMLAYTKIQAPFDGVVTRRHIDVGQLTRPGAEADPLFVLARTDVVTAVVDVPESFAAEVGPGDPVRLVFPALGGPALEARVTRTAWAIDPHSRTLRVEADLPNPGERLRPGLYAQATIVAQEHANVLTVPLTAVVKEKDGAYCMTLVSGQARRRPVTLGLTDLTLAEVSGLDPSDAVVKSGAASLSDGQAVEVLTPPKP